jgi:hypothetical protein
MSGEDDNEMRFLLFKVWCHGQSLAPPLLGVLCFFSSSLSTLEAVCIMILLTVWPVVSWKAMQRPNFHRVVVGGLVVELIYSYILVVTPARNASTVELLLFIATVLLMVETFAYLLVMFWNRAWFMQSSSPSSRLMVTTDDGFIDRYQVV